MKKTLVILLINTSLSVMLSSVQADRYLQDKDVTDSDLFTGSHDCQSLTYKNGQDWQVHLSGEQNRKSVLELQGFLLEDPVLTRGVTDIATRLVRAFPGKCPAVNVFVVAQGSPLLYEAMTSSLGEIFVHYGVLKQAETGDELAAVIAHELAHVYLGHTKKIDMARQISDYIDTSSSLREFYSTTDNTEYNKESQRLESNDEEIAKEMRKISRQRKQAMRHYLALHASLFSRGNELDADRLAVDLLAGAGFSPVAMTTVLSRLGESYQSIEKLQKEADDTVTALMQDNLDHFNTAGKDDPSTTEYARESAASALETLSSEGEGWFKSMMRSSHPRTEKRLEKINKYMLKELSRQERRPPSEPSILLLQDGYVAKLIENTEAANTAYVELARGNLEGAEENILKAISSPTANNAYSRYLAFAIRNEQAKKALATRNLELFDDSEWVSVDAIEEMAAILIGDGQVDKATRMVKVKESYADKSDFMYPVKIMVLEANDKQEASDALAMECINKEGMAKSIAEECKRISGVDVALQDSGPINAISGALKRLPFGKKDE